MSYASRESGIIPRQEFAAIGDQITDTLDKFEPTEQYLVRDVLVGDDGTVQVVEREGRTPLTEDVQYREIRERQSLAHIDIQDPIPQTLGISRWFNLKMEAAYAIGAPCLRAQRFHGTDCAPFTPAPCGRQHQGGERCVLAGSPELEDVRKENIDIGEFSFFVPRITSQRELNDFDTDFWDRMLSYGYFRLYNSPAATTFGKTFTTPDFRLIYKLRQNTLSKEATAYAFDREMYLATHDIGPDGLTTELEAILQTQEQVSKEIGSDISIGEAVKLYSERQGVLECQDWQHENDVALYAPITWSKARQQLGNYIAKITQLA